MLKLSSLLVVALLAIAAFQTSTAQAQAYTWNGGSGFWSSSNSTQWTPNGIPGAGDDVTINAATTSTVTLSGSQSCRTLTLGGTGATQTLAMPTSTLTIVTSGTIGSTGTLTTGYMGGVTGTGTLTNNGTITMNGGSLSIANLTNNAVFNVSPGSSGSNFSGVNFTNAGLFTFNDTQALNFTNVTFHNASTGDFDIQNNQSISGTGTCSILNDGLFIKDNSTVGTTTISGITFTNNDSIEVSAGNTLFISTLSSYNAGALSGTYILDGTLQLGVAGSISTLSGVLDLNVAAAGIKDSGGSNMLSGLKNITNNATLLLTGNASVAATGNPFNCDGFININSGSTFNAGAGALNLSSSGIVSSSGGTLVATGGINVNGGTVVGNGAITGNLNNGGSITTTAGNANFTVSGNYTQTATGMLLAQVPALSLKPALAVSGTSTLAGNLFPSVTYSATTGDSIPIVAFASGSGQFRNLTANVTSNNLMLSQQATATALNLTVGGPAPTLPPVIVSIGSDSSTVATNTPVNFTATATDPGGFPLTYTWDFGDATPTASGPSVSHSFSSEAQWTVTLTVSNGGSAALNATATLTIIALAPNSGGAGIPNLADGQTTANPLNGLSIKLVKSDGGLCLFSIDINALIRSAFAVSTDFDTIDGRNSTVTGLTPAFKAGESNIYIATTSATDTASNTVAGKARKTIGMSGAEVGATPKVKTPPKNHSITNSQTKGKFSFGKPTGATKGTPDSVIFTGSFELPEGLDLSPSATQEFQFSIGNILDAITINSKGKTVGKATMSRIKKLTITFPRLPKGQTLTTAGQTAKFSVTINQTGLSAAGFDTEGITNTYATNEKSLKSVKRSLQVAMVFAGVVWEATAPVTYTLSSKGDSGVMAGRSGQ